MILLIDNYDSFAHNLARYLRQLGQQVLVRRNDEIDISSIDQQTWTAIVISPGPCTPDQSGVCLDVIDRCHSRIPILGVCLGHQAICQSFGARIVRCQPMHGRSTEIAHQHHKLFGGIPTPFVAGRYHSLVAERASIPAELQIIAQTRGGQVMAVAHHLLPVIGVQFHPESILTSWGYRLLANFLEMAHISVADELVDNRDQQLDVQQQRIGNNSPADYYATSAKQS